GTELLSAALKGNLAPSGFVEEQVRRLALDQQPGRNPIDGQVDLVLERSHSARSHADDTARIVLREHDERGVNRGRERCGRCQTERERPRVERGVQDAMRRARRGRVDEAFPFGGVRQETASREDELALVTEDRGVLPVALDRCERELEGAGGRRAVNDIRDLGEALLSSAEAIDGETQEHREGAVIRMPIRRRGRRDEGGTPRSQLRDQGRYEASASGEQQGRETLVGKVEEDCTRCGNPKTGEGFERLGAPELGPAGASTRAEPP